MFVIFSFLLSSLLLIIAWFIHAFLGATSILAISLFRICNRVSFTFHQLPSTLSVNLSIWLNFCSVTSFISFSLFLIFSEFHLVSSFQLSWLNLTLFGRLLQDYGVNLYFHLGLSSCLLHYSWSVAARECNWFGSDSCPFHVYCLVFLFLKHIFITTRSRCLQKLMSILPFPFLLRPSSPSTLYVDPSPTKSRFTMAFTWPLPCWCSCHSFRHTVFSMS